MHAADPDFAEATSRLLRAWVKSRCGEAFRQLVARHLGMVHSVAVRRLGDQRDAAPDVAQAVFLLLARKEDALPGNVVLGAWLSTQPEAASDWLTEVLSSGESKESWSPSGRSIPFEKWERSGNVVTLACAKLDSLSKGTLSFQKEAEEAALINATAQDHEEPAHPDITTRLEAAGWAPERIAAFHELQASTPIHKNR